MTNNVVNGHAVMVMGMGCARATNALAYVSLVAPMRSWPRPRRLPPGGYSARRVPGTDMGRGSYVDDLAKKLDDLKKR